MNRSSIFIGLLVLSLVVSPAVAARRTFPLNGGPGDITNGIVCDPGHYMKGVRGEVGAWIIHLTVICTNDKIGPDGRVGGSRSVGYFGGNGGTDEPPALCQNNTLIGKMREYLTRDSRMVATLEITCVNPTTFQPVGGLLYFGQGFKASTDDEQDCGSGQLAVGLRANWGKDVNAVSLICDDFPSH